MKIYIVIGHTGEYSDASEWPVCWRPSLAEAEQVVALCNAEAAQFKRWMDSDDGSYGGKTWEEYRSRMFDPSCSVDYTGTSYHVWTVCEDPSEDRPQRPAPGAGSGESR